MRLRSTKTKKSLAILLTTLVVAGITTGAFYFFGATVAAARSYPAQVEDISGGKYYPAVKLALSEAESSIFVVMYVVEVNPRRRDTRAYNLVNELLKAKKRGVEVKVILDQNVDFVKRRHSSDWRVERKSYWCFKMLKDAGINVFYDDITNYTHAKVIIIDEQIIISGSANWTQAALARSVEVNTLTKSKELAKELLAYLAEIKLEGKDKAAAECRESGLFLSWQFLENPDLAPRMMSSADERAFDAYLFLLKQSYLTKTSSFTLNYEEIAEALGLSPRMSRRDYRGRINKTLRKLERRYGLIKFLPEHSKEAEVKLLSYKNKDILYTQPKKDCFELPLKFFNYGWLKELSLRAKFCYLVCLANTGISDCPPWWSKSTKSLSQQYGVSIFVFQKGMGELRRKKLIEVIYDVLVKEPSNRLPKAYKLLPLYDPKKLEAELQALEQKYGLKRYQKARRYAKIVFEENNREIIEDIIKNIDLYGKDSVKEAFAIVAKKRVDNPKRKYSYVVGILRNKTRSKK